MYYIYLIRNQKDNRIYTGYTNDLRRRFNEHKNREPELIYYEAYKSEKDARLREMRLKEHGQTVRRLKERLKNSLR